MKCPNNLFIRVNTAYLPLDVLSYRYTHYKHVYAVAVGEHKALSDVTESIFNKEELNVPCG